MTPFRSIILLLAMQHCRHRSDRVKINLVLQQENMFSFCIFHQEEPISILAQYKLKHEYNTPAEIMLYNLIKE